jgi:NADPH:quinone reductase-like Zn-dependent oxidoreductase
VTGVASADKVDFVRSLGADDVIDYTTTDFTETGARYDVIIDIVGTTPLSKVRRCLTRKGTLVLVGGQGRWTGVGRQLLGVLLSPFVSQRLTMFISTPRLHDLEELRDLVASGRVTPVVDATYPLEDAPDAVRALASGASRGKIAIVG